MSEIFCCSVSSAASPGASFCARGEERALLAGEGEEAKLSRERPVLIDDVGRYLVAMFSKARVVAMAAFSSADASEII